MLVVSCCACSPSLHTGLEGWDRFWCCLDKYLSIHSAISHHLFSVIWACLCCQLCLPSPAWISAEYRSLFPADTPDSTSKEGKLTLLGRFKTQLSEWGNLLRRFLRSEDDQVRPQQLLVQQQQLVQMVRLRLLCGRAWKTLFVQLLVREDCHGTLGFGPSVQCSSRDSAERCTHKWSYQQRWCATAGCCP